MKTLKFKSDGVKKIVEGYKTSTRRLFDEKNIKAWEDLEFINSETGEVFAHAVSTEVYEKKLSELSQEDYSSQEKFDGTEEVLKRFKEYYGEDKVTLDTPVKVIKFKLV